MRGSVGYRIRLRVQGQLDAAWWPGLFSDLVLTVEPEGTSLLTGMVTDQAALHGLMATIRDLGLSLVSLETTAVLQSQPSPGGTNGKRSR